MLVLLLCGEELPDDIRYAPITCGILVGHTHVKVTGPEVERLVAGGPASMLNFTLVAPGKLETGLKMQNEKLDTEELQHLALEAMGHGDNKEALALLKQAVASDQSNGQVFYLLGAVHAQIGMYERAIVDMSRAVELLPDLYPAHFQLGLLYLTSGKVEEAKAAWKPLEALDSEHPFELFRKGLEFLVVDDFEACIQYLEKGIERNQINLPLNEDMAKVIKSSQEALRNRAPQGPAVESQEPHRGRHVLLSSYRQDESTED